MTVKMKIHRDDEVIVISGKDKGVRGRVIRVFPKENKLVVTGVNVVRRHIRSSASHPEGGIQEMEKAIHASNVQIIDPSSGKATRIGFKMIDGKKVRFAKASGELIDK